MTAQDGDINGGADLIARRGFKAIVDLLASPGTKPALDIQ